MFRLPGGCFLHVRPYIIYWSPADCLPACLPVLAEFLSCSPASPALVIVVLRIAVLIPAPSGIYALHSPSCLPAGRRAQAIRGRSVMGWSSEAGCVDPMSLCIA